MATTLPSSLRCSAAGAVNSSGSIWRHANGNAGALLRLPKRRQDARPADLVEPTGQGREELQAIWDALVEEPLQPVLLALQEIAATGGNIFRCRCFHAGLVSCRVAPNLCMDIVLGQICYKLSVLASQLKRDGRANSICARVQFALLVVLVCKSNNSNMDAFGYVTQLIRALAMYVYACTVYYECIGVKHPRRYLEAIYKTLLTTKGGLLKVLKFMFLGIE